MRGKFKFSAQDSALEYLFWRSKNPLISSALKPPYRKHSWQRINGLNFFFFACLVFTGYFINFQIPWRFHGILKLQWNWPYFRNEFTPLCIQQPLHWSLTVVQKSLNFCQTSKFSYRQVKCRFINNKKKKAEDWRSLQRVRHWGKGFEQCTVPILIKIQL